MMLPPVVPWKFGPVMPVGSTPATTDHWTGVGVAPLLVVVSQPVVSNHTAVGSPTAPVAVGAATMVQLRLGWDGWLGTGVTVGVQPASVTVVVGVRPSRIVILQSGAVKSLACTLNRPLWSARAPAALVVDSTMAKTPGALRPSTRSSPLLSAALVTDTAPAVPGRSAAPTATAESAMDSLAKRARLDMVAP